MKTVGVEMGGALKLSHAIDKLSTVAGYVASWLVLLA